ncbi:MAG: hypothetical protein WA949_04865 [Phormidesmis sp.]
MPSNWLSIKRFVPLLFAPAGIGLVLQAVYPETPAQQLLALALALFCPELARMAKVDLDNVAATMQQVEDARLSRFLFVVVSTIVLELLGFYSALISLSVGALVIVGSQLWFNLLAELQLQPGQTPAVVSFGISRRMPVLLANMIGLLLLSLWFVPELAPELRLGSVAQVRRWLSGGMLMLVTVFLLIKYVILGVISGVLSVTITKHEQ